MRFPIVTMHFSTRWISADVGRWPGGIAAGGRWIATRTSHAVLGAGSWLAHRGGRSADDHWAEAAHPHEDPAAEPPRSTEDDGAPASHPTHTGA
ncbi:hypothetical protein [Krasilnikovia sp. MM14-A1004]|uniref:hypothetical protein n=1 Tax=Krasilnikovia sp. MM14-A1004 TaxID=3373541 RepID=UPI00399D4690